jgi:cytoskeletal protein RodZ
MDINQSLEQYVPDKLLGSFKHSSFTLALLISLGIHLAAIGGTSVGYITDRWVDPEGAKQRKIEAQARLQAAAASNLVGKAAAVSNVPSGTVSNAPAPAGAAPGAAAVTSAPAAATNELNRTNTAIMKQLNETAKPEEIPSAPNDLGISIKDTNPQ